MCLGISGHYFQCDLHKKYREEKVKIYPPVVFTYVNTLPVLRVYERVFDPEGMKERVFNSKKEAEAATAEPSVEITE